MNAADQVPYCCVGPTILYDAEDGKLGEFGEFGAGGRAPLDQPILGVARLADPNDKYASMPGKAQPKPMASGRFVEPACLHVDATPMGVRRTWGQAGGIKFEPRLGLIARLSFFQLARYLQTWTRVANNPVNFQGRGGTGTGTRPWHDGHPRVLYMSPLPACPPVSAQVAPAHRVKWHTTMTQWGVAAANRHTGRFLNDSGRAQRVAEHPHAVCHPKS